MEPSIAWSIKWKNGSDPPVIRINIEDERKKQIYKQINKMLHSKQVRRKE